MLELSSDAEAKGLASTRCTQAFCFFSGPFPQTPIAWFLLLLMSNSVHLPVLLETILENLGLAPGSTVVDGTLGGGGHSLSFCEQVGQQGRVFGFDRDPAAAAPGKHTDARLGGETFDDREHMDAAIPEGRVPVWVVESL